MKRAATILAFDLRNLSRDSLLPTILSLVACFFVAIVVAGLNREALGLAFLEPWVPLLLLFILVTNLSSFGMLFGLILVEEVETGTRAALMVSPIPAARLVLLRTPWILLSLTLLPLAAVYGTYYAWDVTAFALVHWVVLAAVLAPLGAAIMISISTFATNRVEAMALGKFYSVFTVPALLLVLLPDGAWYRYLFQVLPTAPVVEAFEALAAGRAQSAYLWLLWAVIYIALVVLASVGRFVRRSYRVAA